MWLLLRCACRGEGCGCGRGGRKSRRPTWRRGICNGASEVSARRKWGVAETGHGMSRNFRPLGHVGRQQQGACEGRVKRPSTTVRLSGLMLLGRAWTSRIELGATTTQFSFRLLPLRRLSLPSCSRRCPASRHVRPPAPCTTSRLPPVNASRARHVHSLHSPAVSRSRDHPRRAHRSRNRQQNPPLHHPPLPQPHNPTPTLLPSNLLPPLPRPREITPRRPRTPGSPAGCGARGRTAGSRDTPARGRRSTRRGRRGARSTGR